MAALVLPYITADTLSYSAMIDDAMFYVLAGRSHFVCQMPQCDRNINVHKCIVSGIYAVCETKIQYIVGTHSFMC